MVIIVSIHNIHAQIHTQQSYVVYTQSTPARTDGWIHGHIHTYIYIYIYNYIYRTSINESIHTIHSIYMVYIHSVFAQYTYTE